MEIIRDIIIYGNYFAEFYDRLGLAVKRKINYVLALIRIEEHIPTKFLRKIENVPGLYEIRAEAEGNIYRIFCCFDEGKVIILFNGFQKKTQKTPQEELKRAKSIMKEYFDSKKRKN